MIALAFSRAASPEMFESASINMTLDVRQRRKVLLNSSVLSSAWKSHLFLSNIM